MSVSEEAYTYISKRVNEVERENEALRADVERLKSLLRRVMDEDGGEGELFNEINAALAPAQPPKPEPRVTPEDLAKVAAIAEATAKDLRDDAALRAELAEPSAVEAKTSASLVLKCRGCASELDPETATGFLCPWCASSKPAPSEPEAKCGSCGWLKGKHSNSCSLHNDLQPAPNVAKEPCDLPCPVCGGDRHGGHSYDDCLSELKRQLVRAIAWSRAWKNSHKGDWGAYVRRLQRIYGFQLKRAEAAEVRLEEVEAKYRSAMVDQARLYAGLTKPEDRARAEAAEAKADRIFAVLTEKEGRITKALEAARGWPSWTDKDDLIAILEGK